MNELLGLSPDALELKYSHSVWTGVPGLSSTVQDDDVEKRQKLIVEDQDPYGESKTPRTRTESTQEWLMPPVTGLTNEAEQCRQRNRVTFWKFHTEFTAVREQAIDMALLSVFIAQSKNQ